MLFLNQYVTGDFGDGSWLRHGCVDGKFLLAPQSSANSRSSSRGPSNPSSPVNLWLLNIWVCIYIFQKYLSQSVAVYGSLITAEFFFIIITLTWIDFKKRISIMKLLHLCVMNDQIFLWQDMHNSLFFLEKKSEIWNAFTFFEKWKVNLFFLSLILRVKSEI